MLLFHLGKIKNCVLSSSNLIVLLFPNLRVATVKFQIPPTVSFSHQLRCTVAWHAEQSVIRFCSESSPDWLRNSWW